jgi:phospholipase C
MRKWPAVTAAAVMAGVLAALVAASATRAQATTPIAHIVVLMQENHSLDSELGYWCDQNPSRCTGLPTSVTLADGKVIKPGIAPDIVPNVSHNMASQEFARLNEWDRIYGCGAKTGYACISGYEPSAVPNLVSLASRYTILDHAFTLANAPSWGGHLDELAATTDGFTGDNPTVAPGYTGTVGPAWGCNATGKVATMLPVAGVTPPPQPSCIPDFSLDPVKYPYGGAWEPTIAAHVPTILDKMDTAGVTWNIYGGTNASAWAACPSFASCLDTAQDTHLLQSAAFFTAAAAGTLPQVSFVMPAGNPSIGCPGTNSDFACSQHNEESNAVGDNWIGKIASTLFGGLDGASSALIITWDDCGCFYDPTVPPLAPDGRQMGPRVPFVLVSPYARPQYTDTTVTSSTGSILAFIEADFGLPALGANDAGADNLMGDFSFTAAHRLRLPRMVSRKLPAAAYRLAPYTARDPT